MNKAFKVVLINIAMFSVLMEIGGQLLKKRHEFNLSKLNMFIPWKQAYTDYLAYVNHFRDFNYSKKAEMPYSVTPSNINTDTELLYSCYGENCNNNKSYELLIQGDSWAEGLTKNSIIDKPYSFKNKHNLCWNNIIFTKQYGGTIGLSQRQRIQIQDHTHGDRPDGYRR